MDNDATIRLPGDQPSVPLNLEDFGAQADRILAEARAEADRILAEARAEAESDTAARDAAVEAAARDAGYAEGSAQGRAEAMEHIRSQGQQAVDLARRITDELAAQQTALAERLSGQAMRFSVELAERIVHRVAAQDPAVAMENLRKALALSAGGSSLTVHVHPGQRELLQRYCGQFVRELGRGGPVRLVGDESMAAGGVKVVTPGGQVDATIETQLARMVEALLGPQTGQDNPGTYVSEKEVRENVSL